MKALGRGGVVLGDGGGYLAKVEVHGEDEHGERGGHGLGGGGGLGRAVTIKDSMKDLSKLFFRLGYLADVEVHGEDEHGELGGGGAGPERGGDGLGSGELGGGGDGGG